MRDIFELEKNTEILKDNSYLISYPHIMSYFADLEEIQEQDLVRGSHMVYGWMPTILDLYPNDQNKSLHEISLILTKAKNGQVLTENDLSDISSVINNSLVGTSKILHFINPECYAIWDSKIFSFIHNIAPYNYRVNKPKLYIEYLGIIRELKNNENFSNFHNSVNEKVGYTVSAMRSVELIMFLNAPA